MEPLLIIGMYKSGTSWLLASLSAHPQCIGFREVDLIKAFGAYSRFPFIKKTFRPHNPAARVQSVFGKSAFCHLPVSFYPELLHESGQALLDLPTSLVIDRITNHVVQQRSGVRESTDHALPHNFLFLSQKRLEHCYHTLAHADTVSDFVNTVFALVEEEIAERGLQNLRYYTFKGADQIAFIDALQPGKHPIKKLLILRDGRDMAISAIKFKKLMLKRKAAWTKADTTLDYFTLLKHWSRRAALVRARMDDETFYVLRYEDLNLRFTETFAALLDWLGLDASPDLIDAIQSQTSFEAVTGRKRGEEKEAVIRKGAVREWADVLSEEEKARAWTIAGKQLRAWGYPEQ